MTGHKTNAYLFAWSPSKWPWLEIGENSEALAQGEKISDSWTCVSHKKIRPGDRAFFSKVGAEPRGIFASGYIASEPYLGKNRKGNDAYRIYVEYDVILDPATTPILTLDLLNIGPMAKQMWTPQSCGISIRDEVAEELEKLWEDFLANKELFAKEL